MALCKFWLGKVFQNVPSVDFHEHHLKNMLDFCFIILNTYSLMITLKKRVHIFFRNQIVFMILNFIKANFDWWKALEKYLLMQTIS